MVAEMNLGNMGLVHLYSFQGIVQGTIYQQVQNRLKTQLPSHKGILKKKL